MPSGSISLNGITDEQYVKLIQIKDKSQGKLAFGANASIGQSSNANIGGKTVSIVNGVNLNFSDADGAKFAAEVLQMAGS